MRKIQKKLRLNKTIINKTSRHLIYLKERLSTLNESIYSAFNSAWNLLPNKDNLIELKKNLPPVLLSVTSFLLGETLTNQIIKSNPESENTIVIFKFIISSFILAYSATHRITEKKVRVADFPLMSSSEIVAITYLYQSSFQGSQLCLNSHLTDQYKLLISLGVSSLVVPGILTKIVKKYQDTRVKKLINLGSQRYDTALISSGKTPIANTFFLSNALLWGELKVFSRFFQLGLIGHNTIHSEIFINQFRNFPALLADVLPTLAKRLSSQKALLKNDTDYNTTLELVLKKTGNKNEWVKKCRHELRLGDLVQCNEEFNSFVPISGEMVSFYQGNEGYDLNHRIKRKYQADFKALTGENRLINFETQLFESKVNEIDLKNITKGEEVAILRGASLKTNQFQHFFIKVKKEKEFIEKNQDYEKNSVINQIISNHKNRQAYYALAFSVIVGGILSIREPSLFLNHSSRLLFNLFQMFIPFSENILRHGINLKLLNKLNKNLPKEKQISSIDCLRVVDLINAINGYYKDRYSNVVLISDKTNTLTTSDMIVRGLSDIDKFENANVLLKEEKENFLLNIDQNKLKNYQEIFACAFTNNTADIEPEENEILKFLFPNNNIRIENLNENHFLKTIFFPEGKKIFETIHLGLYSKTLGGRLTLVKENEKYFLVFCGIPKAKTFQHTPLFINYSKMQMRQNVLSRDWCIARASISSDFFNVLYDLFKKDNTTQINELICSDNKILNSFEYYATFLIDNPVKKGAENFINQMKNVFIATGDTVNASENIAKVFYPGNNKKIIKVTNEMEIKLHDEDYSNNTIIIFAGINNQFLLFFDELMRRDAIHRPIIIFSEMSGDGKELLAKHLKALGFYVVVMGDGKNDTGMMSVAHTVIAHLSKNGNYSPGVEQYANLNDEQVCKLFQSDKSFYELFDIHQSQSQFAKKFIPIANIQELPSLALMLKTVKMSFELVQALDFFPVKQMPYQHWYSVGFDLAWLAISFFEIEKYAHLSRRNKHLGSSYFPMMSLTVLMFITTLDASIRYSISEESTNLTTMLAYLAILPFALKILFSTFRSEGNKSSNSKEIESPQEKLKFKSSFLFFKNIEEEKLPSNESFLRTSQMKFS